MLSCLLTLQNNILSYVQVMISYVYPVVCTFLYTMTTVHAYRLCIHYVCCWYAYRLYYMLLVDIFITTCCWYVYSVCVLYVDGMFIQCRCPVCCWYVYKCMCTVCCWYVYYSVCVLYVDGMLIDHV